MVDDIDTLIPRLQALIPYLKSQGVKTYRTGGLGLFEIEFFESKPVHELDPKKLIETLNDGMPPDTDMLFASSEDINHSDGNTDQMTG